MPKIEYQGNDFFERPDFRGLYMADFGEKLGDQAYQWVSQLNASTISNFSNLRPWREAMVQKQMTNRVLALDKLNTTSRHDPRTDTNLKRY